MRALPILTLLISAFILAAETPEPLPADPMAWTPPKERPVLQERLTGDDFDKRRANAWSNMQRENVKEVHAPKRGLRVWTVNVGGAAEALGLQEGDILLSLDGTELKSPQHLNDLRKPNPQELVFWSFDTLQNKTVDIPPGRIGIDTEVYYNVMHWPYKDTPADNRWEADIRLALFCSTSDPDLSETLLARAFKAGLPATAEMDELATDVLYNGWRLREALDYGWIALERNPISTQARSIVILCAWLLNKYEVGLAAAKGHPGLLTNLQAAMEARVAEHRAQPAPARLSIPALQQAKRLYQDSLVVRSEGFPWADGTDPEEAFRDTILQGIFTRLGLRFSVETDHFRSIAFGPAVENLLLEFDFTLKPTDAEKSRYTKHFTAGIFQTEGPRARSVALNGMNKPMLGITCTSETFEILQFNSALTVKGSHKKLFSETRNPRAHRFKLAVWNRRVEMELDGRTIYSGPLGLEAPRLGVVLKCVGTTFELSNFRACELMDDARKDEVLKRDIDKPYRSNYTRLHFAAQSGDLAATRELLKFNPDLEPRTAHGEQPLHCAVRAAFPGVAQAIHEKGAPLDLPTAAGLGNAKALKDLLAALPPPDLNNAACGWSGLHGAVIANDPAIAAMLLKEGANINARAAPRFYRQTPLMWAALYPDREKTAQFLLEKGAEINAGCIYKYTALRYAEDNKRTALAALLKARKALREAPPEVALPPPERGPAPAVRPPEPPPGDF